MGTQKLKDEDLAGVSGGLDWAVGTTKVGDEEISGVAIPESQYEEFFSKFYGQINIGGTIGIDIYGTKHPGWSGGKINGEDAMFIAIYNKQNGGATEAEVKSLFEPHFGAPVSLG